MPINTTLRQEGFDSRNIHRLVTGDKRCQTEIKFALAQCLAEGRKELNSRFTPPLPARAARLVHQLGFFDGHAAINSLAHVIEGERRH